MSGRYYSCGGIIIPLPPLLSPTPLLPPDNVELLRFCSFLFEEQGSRPATPTGPIGRSAEVLNTCDAKIKRKKTNITNLSVEQNSTV